MVSREVDLLVGILHERVGDVPLVTPLNSHRGRRASGEIRVLHVDDEPGFADMTATFLEELQDQFTVETTTSASEGLDRLESEAFDCVVSDYQMPGVDGLDFLTAVRDEYPDLPFILFTGRGSEEIASDAIAAGVTDYMQKETGTDQYEVLANRIQNAIDRYLTAEELWNTLSWYRRLVEQELAGIYLVQDEEIIYVNARLAEMFGYDQSGLIGASALSIVAERDRALVRENLHRRQTGNQESLRYSFTGVGKDGKELDIEVHGGVVEFEGEPAVMGLLLDVSDRRA